MLAERLAPPLLAVALFVGATAVTAVATLALTEPEPEPEVALACPPPALQLQLHSDFVIAHVPADIGFAITPPAVDDAIVVLDVITITADSTAR